MIPPSFPSGPQEGRTGRLGTLGDIRSKLRKSESGRRDIGKWNLAHEQAIALEKLEKPLSERKLLADLHGKAMKKLEEAERKRVKGQRSPLLRRISRFQPTSCACSHPIAQTRLVIPLGHLFHFQSPQII